MKWKLDFEIDNWNQIDFEDPIIMMGSCFTENIGAHMVRHKFPVNINPFGILYNPYSTLEALKRLVSGRDFTEEDLIKNGEFYHSLMHHGSFSSISKEEFLADINQSLKAGKEHLKRSKYIIISLGTAWVYRHIERNQIVANCHKIPAAFFTKELLVAEEVDQILDEMATLFKDKNLLFTISPIRHVKDGLAENQNSKSILIQGVHKVLRTHSNCRYFPSYEIMMDELRDYRFYEQDLIHPNKQAIDYIWERFRNTSFNSATLNYINDSEKVLKYMQHRSLFEGSDSDQKFREKREKVIREHQKKWNIKL